jgi:hypothetical protein
MSKHVAHRSQIARVLLPALTVTVILVVVAATVMLMRPARVSSALAAADSDKVASPADVPGAATVTDQPDTDASASTGRSKARAGRSPHAPPASKVDRQLARLARLAEKAKILDGTVLEKLPPTTFNVASFNVLGAGHTTAGGRHARYASGPARMPGAVSLLGSHGVSVAGLQEFEAPQHAAFNNHLPNWGIYPTVNQVRGNDSANAVVWDQAVWSLERADLIYVPYFHGKPHAMPYVQLRNLATGQLVWFATFHNPADVRGPAARWRAVAVAREADLANALAQSAPVVFTGDMNDRADYYCPMTARSDLEAAQGGSNDGSCAPPAEMGIDWILGTPDVTFTSWASLRNGVVGRTSDHPFVYAQAQIVP